MLMTCAIFSKIYWLQFELSSYLAANKILVFEKHQYWRLLTTTFVHGDMGHFLSNAYMLGILGFFVYAYFGSLIYPVFTFFLSGIVNAIALNTYHPEVFLIGASGLVYLLAGFWLTMFICIERRRTVFRRLLVAMGVGLLILFPTSFEANVSYRTHAIGVGLGTLFAIVYFMFFKDRIRQAEVWKVIHEEPLPEEFEEI